MVSGTFGDLNVMTNGFENVAEEPSDGDLVPLQYGADCDSGQVASGKARAPRPWGAWATVGWTILCLVALFGVQIAVEIIFVVMQFAVRPVRSSMIRRRSSLISRPTAICSQRPRSRAHPHSLGSLSCSSGSEGAPFQNTLV